jgi:hypothetical protein
MKCAHPGCKCEVNDPRLHGSYCSEHCREAGDKTEPKCHCHHAACQES